VSTRTWIAEFGSGYEIPDSIAQNPLLFDMSWHNDVCPSFCLATHADKDSDYCTWRLWVEHPDRELREEGDTERFFVTPGDGTADTVYAGEDANEAIRLLTIAQLQHDVMKLYLTADIDDRAALAFLDTATADYTERDIEALREMHKEYTERIENAANDAESLRYAETDEVSNAS
jgi:hypothetical protein